MKELNKNNVTSKEVELGGKMTLMWEAEEGTSNTMLYNAKERERESSVISRCRATQCRVTIVISYKRKHIVLK